MVRALLGCIFLLAGRNDAVKQNRPIQLESGAHRKNAYFRRHRSFPNTGGPGVSTQTLSPDRVSGLRLSSHGLSLAEGPEVGVTGLVYAGGLKYAIGSLENHD